MSENENGPFDDLSIGGDDRPDASESENEVEQERPYAKLYSDETYNQILIVQLFNEELDMIEVTIFFQPPGKGICDASVQFENTAKGWSDADAVFDSLDKESAIEKIQEMES